LNTFSKTQVGSKSYIHALVTSDEATIQFTYFDSWLHEFYRVILI